MADSALIKALLGEEYQYSPKESVIGSLGYGVSQSLPALVNPYGSTGKNLATVLGGSLLAGLFGYQAKKEAEQKNLAQAGYMQELLSGGITPEREKEILAADPKLAKLTTGIKLQELLGNIESKAALKKLEAQKELERYKSIVSGAAERGMTPEAFEKALTGTSTEAPTPVKAPEISDITTGALPSPEIEQPKQAKTLQQLMKTDAFDPEEAKRAYANYPENLVIGSISKVDERGIPKTLKEIKDEEKVIRDSHRFNKTKATEQRDKIANNKISEAWVDIDQKWSTARSLALSDDKASENRLINLAQKISDPTSTITIPEYKLASDVQSYLDGLKGELRSLGGKSRLTPENRRRIVEIMGEFRSNIGKAYNQLVRKTTEDQAAMGYTSPNTDFYYHYKSYIGPEEATRIKRIREQVSKVDSPAIRNRLIGELKLMGVKP